jgi:hypothetical protein
MLRRWRRFLYERPNNLVFDVDVCPYHHPQVVFTLKRQIKRPITLIHSIKNSIKLNGHSGRDSLRQHVPDHPTAELDPAARLASRAASCGSLIFLVCAAHHDPQACPSANGRCSALASSHGARIQTSRSSSVVKDHRHSLGVDRLDQRVRRGRQEPVDEVRAGDWLRLGPTVAAEFGPDTGKSKQRPVIVEREPDKSFFLVSGFGTGAYSEKLLPAPGIGSPASANPASAATTCCGCW